MNPHTRAAMAAIALAHSQGSRVTSIYDYDARKYLSIEVNLSGKAVRGYDYTVRAHFDGTLPNLYHYGDRAHLEMKESAGKYVGYDYGSRCHFEVTVRGKNVEVYDYGARKWFTYSP